VKYSRETTVITAWVYLYIFVSVE